MLNLSKSKIQTLTNCPLKFYFTYILDPKPEKDTILDDKYLLAGLEVHRRLDKIYDKIDENKYINMDVVDKADYLYDLFGKPDTKNEEANDIISLARSNFVDHQIKIDRKFGNGYAKPYKREEFCQFIIKDSFIKKFIEPRKDTSTGIKIKNMKPLGEEILLRGIIDRVDEFSDGTYGILDYKSKTSSVHHWELSGYMLMASIYFHLPQINKIGCWGYKDNSSFYKDVKPRNIDYFLYKVLEFKNNYDKFMEKGKWSRKRGFMCRFCEYQKLCKSYNRYGDICQ